MILHTKNNSIHFEDIIHTHLNQSSSCIILGIDIKKKKKKLDTVRHCFRDQHNCKLSSEMILTLTQFKPINSKYIL